jgi:hypothetical protein
MSTARVNQLDLTTPPVAQALQQKSLLVGAFFAVISGIIAVVSPEKFFHAYLLAYMLCVGLTLGCLAWLMIQHVTGGVWGTVIRRPLEAGTRTLPLMALLFLPLILGMSRYHLYAWTDAAEVAKSAHLQMLTAAYLNPRGFIWRAVFYFVVWGLLIYFLNRYSAEQDRPLTRDVGKSIRKVSAPGLVIFALTVSFAVIDWVMSLDPHWMSTIYPLIFIVGQCLSAICLMVVVERIFSSRPPMLLFLKPREVHDHGKFMLTFIMLWAYFSFSQLLIIWAGNLPDEITWYTRRLYGGWQYVGLFIAAFHFAVPFLFLLSRSFKRSPISLVWLASWMLFMRVIDLLWHIEPNFYPTVSSVGGLDVAAWIVVPVGMGGLWLALFFLNLKGRPLLPLYDPKSQVVLGPAHE